MRFMTVLHAHMGVRA